MLRPLSYRGGADEILLALSLRSKASYENIYKKFILLMVRGNFSFWPKARGMLTNYQSAMQIILSEVKLPDWTNDFIIRSTLKGQLQVTRLLVLLRAWQKKVYNGIFGESYLVEASKYAEFLGAGVGQWLLGVGEEVVPPSSRWTFWCHISLRVSHSRCHCCCSIILEQSDYSAVKGWKMATP